MTNEELLYNIHYWEKEKLDAMVEHNVKEDARKTGHEQGLIEGLNEGRAEGLAEGIAEGLKEGRAEGIEANKLEMIKNLLLQNVDYNIISNASGKRVEEIKEIEERLKEEK